MLLIFRPSFIISLCFLDWNPAKNSICPPAPRMFGAQSPCRSACSPIRGSLSFSPTERVTSRAAGYIELLWHATCNTWQLGHNSCPCLHPSDTHSQVVFLSEWISEKVRHPFSDKLSFYFLLFLAPLFGLVISDPVFICPFVRRMCHYLPRPDSSHLCVIVPSSLACLICLSLFVIASLSCLFQ